MRSNRTLRTAVALALAGAASVAFAQSAPDTAQLETVIVTGTYIRGTAEDAALPVDVITAEDLAKQGSPSTLEMLKSLSVSNGVLGDSNQFDARAQGSEGSGSVNLRGLGPQRTLVLLNGRRMVNSPFTGAIDTNLLPSAAIGRVEVLKDGAAATYGSDAIAGVVNFITKTGQTGLDLAADYKYIADSDGDYTAGATYGWANDTLNFLVSGGYQHRSELMARDRDWATRPYLENPQGGWSAAGNPATFVPIGVTTPTTTPANPLGAGLTFRDPQCGPLGAYPGFTGSLTAPTPVCYWQYSKFDALTEKEERYQAYAEVNAKFGSDTKLHAEVLYSGTETPIYRTSPSYAALQTPCALTASTTCTAGTSPVASQYYVSPSNPGYIAFQAANPGLLVSTPVAGAPLAGALVVAYRPFAVGGNPLFDYDSSEGPRRYHAIRGSVGLNGSISEAVNYDVAVTYMEQNNKREGRDTVVNRLELGLRGLGGPNCLTNTPGLNGCLWLNPFNNAIPRNAITGVANSQYSATANNENRDLLNWVFPKVSTEQIADIVVADVVFNGTTGITLPGGDLAWAAGVQYRDQNLKSTYSDLNNFAVVPCVNSVANGIVGPSACTPAQLAAPGGPLLFLGGAFDSSFSQDVSAVFTEISLPFFESFQAQLAARYEDYGGNIGSTFDPKLSLRWQIVDAFALRGSVGTTFRGPPLNLVSGNTVTTLQSIAGTFRAIRTAGNPNLSPESAFTFNVGALAKGGGFTASLDYWSFDFDDQIVTEPVSGIVSSVFGAGTTCSPTHPLAGRFTFNDTNANGVLDAAECSTTNIARLDIGWINGPKLKTSGLDLSVKYDAPFLDGLSTGINATYVLKYEIDPVVINGVEVQAKYDAAGKLNYQTTAYPLPKLKGSMFFEYAKDIHNLRWVINYVDSYEDQRTDIFLPSAATNAGPAGAGAVGNTTAAGYVQANNITIAGGKTVASTTLHSLYYQLQLPADLTLTLAVENIFDKDPSFARLDYSYDPFTGSAFGRTAKLGARWKF